jgi:ureidoglycolate amidohydrolase
MIEVIPNLARMLAELEELAGFSSVPAPAVTRVLYSPEDTAARQYLRQRCLEAGLSWREDAIGNTFIRLDGYNDSLAPVATGSHIDAIPFSGKFDGVVGVLAGIEALRSLQEAGFRPERSLEVVLFTAEEPTRFGLGCLGSRALAGTIDRHDLEALRDDQGQSLDVLRADAGFVGQLDDLSINSGYYHAFIELHIEQGPILERENLEIGIVTAIAAPFSAMLSLKGVGGHAGALLMPERRDALCGASEVILALEHVVIGVNTATNTNDTVGTVGLCDVYPGAINSVPSQVRLGIDIRDVELARRDVVVEEFRQRLDYIIKNRSLELQLDIINADPPAQSAPKLVETVQHLSDDLGYRSRLMVSRAYHDSLFMAKIAPMVMIFIPCRGGVSHRPDEYSAPADIERGLTLLTQTLWRLANDP